MECCKYRVERKYIYNHKPVKSADQKHKNKNNDTKNIRNLTNKNLHRI